MFHPTVGQQVHVTDFSWSVHIKQGKVKFQSFTHADIKSTKFTVVAYCGLILPQQIDRMSTSTFSANNGSDSKQTNNTLIYHNGTGTYICIASKYLTPIT